MSELLLPDAPSNLTGPVKAWQQPVTIDTYLPMPADRNPMFLEKRVYQGSSGKVYPLPFTDRISETRIPRAWDAVHIENEFVRLMVLPEIGGRIHVGLDKTNGYDFFYRQNVIKPALVGLAGPWISGGVEFNWPQHHRPSTFMPVDVRVEEHTDGSRTIWCSEHEPMNRMKGMHGICLHPGKSFIELKVRLYNRTELTQTFLWWANVAARVHEKYQSFFPPDVNYVADHAKRAMSRFPHCDGFYYGVNYGKRGRDGVLAAEMPRQFIPPGGYFPDDLSWYSNIPVPTSYMAMGSRENFFGGYDFSRDAGLIHYANHHISPGKKQWTWGNHEFGYAWDRNLTDSDGPYIELMAGVYTDNQPDFSFLHPGETRTFSQFWYPIQKIGPAQHANLDAAVSLHIAEGKARAGVAVSSEFKSASVSLRLGGRIIHQRSADLSPEKPLVFETACDGDASLTVTDANGRIVIEYSPVAEIEKPVPPPATEPALPRDIAGNDELYLTGLHLEQYRHATRNPADYWREALRRDPTDSRCNTAMGIWHLRRGEFSMAAEHLQKAVDSRTRRNPNPSDGEALYYLGIALRYLGRDQSTYDALYKSTWNFAWQSPAFLALAELDCRKSDWPTALEHLDRSLRVNVDNSRARNLKAIVLRRLGREAEAAEILKQTLAADPLDFSALYLSGEPIDCDAQTRLDLALDFARAGFFDEAVKILPAEPTTMTEYARAYFQFKFGKPTKVRQTSVDYCFPSRLEEIAILQSAIDADATDARARYLLGNLFYDRRPHEEAIALWERSAQLDPRFAIVWRNLGIGYFNIRSDAPSARAAYDRAFTVNPRDARVLFERDQLWKRTGESPENRLAELQRNIELVHHRDDLCVELCALLNQTGQHESALEILRARKFQPWEGGEGLALGQHVRTHLSLGRKALRSGNAAEARRFFELALNCPENLSEARHLLANAADIHFWIGEACQANGDVESARQHWSIAAETRGDFQEMSVRAFSEMTYFSAISLRRLGRDAEATQLLHDLVDYARKLENTPAKIDYFATSLPAMLIFEDDLQKRQTIQARLLAAQAKLGLEERGAAEKLLREILQDDPNHPLAADLLGSIKSEETHAMR